MNVLLVEPDYRSKFPPLGLMRISAFHKERGDSVSFTRGCSPELRLVPWHRVYVSSLFTYELPRTVKTVEYYLPVVENPAEDLFVGGIGATLLPEYIGRRVPCRVIAGALDRRNALGLGEEAIAEFIPDYTLLNSVAWKYQPEDAYFVRVSMGCIRSCKFCAVPRLEPCFRYLQSVSEQLNAVRAKYGERHDLVILDNNILALEKDRLFRTIDEIKDQGFHKGGRVENKKRAVDFNQGIDARLVTPEIATRLSTICLSPVRLAFDYDSVENEYKTAVELLSSAGFATFTTYVMYNYNDTPESFYRRMSVNLELSVRLGIRVTGFPMRYVPIADIDRHFVSKHWKWRYLRGIQCILNATHGMVSPNPAFFEAAFGQDFEQFLEICAMPERFIIYRNKYAAEADAWRCEYRRV